MIPFEHATSDIPDSGRKTHAQNVSKKGQIKIGFRILSLPTSYIPGPSTCSDVRATGLEIESKNVVTLW